MTDKAYYAVLLMKRQVGGFCDFPKSHVQYTVKLGVNSSLVVRGTDGRCLAHTPTLLPCSCQTLQVGRGDSLPRTLGSSYFQSRVLAGRNIGTREEFLVVGVTHQLEVGQ